jgi:hypothetical protein
MKRVLGLVIVFAALGLAAGFWVGIQAYQSSSFHTKFFGGLAIAIGGNLLLGLWVWYRARPGSGDARNGPLIALLSAGMLVGILPPVWWPANEGVRAAGSIASAIAVTAVVIIQMRLLRRFRRGV